MGYTDYAYIAGSWVPLLLVIALILWGWTNERRKRRATAHRARPHVR